MQPWEANVKEWAAGRPSPNRSRRQNAVGRLRTNELRPRAVELRTSAGTVGDKGEQAQPGLFGDGELPAGPSVGQPVLVSGALRVMSPQRNQVELRPVDLESLLAQDHATTPTAGSAEVSA